jgi:hypothetical protein
MATWGFTVAESYAERRHRASIGSLPTPDAVDAIVGKMLDTLDDLGIARDTILVFASDNGPEGPGVRNLRR